MTGSLAIWKTLKMAGSGDISSTAWWLNNTREGQSAFPCADVDRNSIWHLYADSKAAQRCSVAAVGGGIPFFGSRIVISHL